MRAPHILPALAAAIALASASHIAHSPLLAAGQRDTMLTPVSWLVQHLHDPNLVILQVGESYATGHVPGAQAASLNQFAAPRNMSAAGPTPALSLELPTDDQLKATLESFGITDRSRIIIVESENYHSPSTRIYLTLVHAGFGSRTSLLDGGLPAWKAAGQPTTADTTPATKSSLSALKTVAVTVDAAYLQGHTKATGIAIVDVRSPAAWAGVEGAGQRGMPQVFGHIPGSVSLPLEDLWDDTTSTLKPASDLEKRFAEAGVKPGDTVIGYCYIGQRATATLFAAQTLGHPVLLYDGSMEEWTALKLPVEKPVKKSGGLR